MQKISLKRDYNNFDYLDATVKLNSLEELKAHYAVLGWECVYFDCGKSVKKTVRAVFRRPHNIKNKDELQLLQVYMEYAWNRIDGASLNPCPKTVAAGLTFGAISLAAVIVGVCAVLSVIAAIPLIWGYVLLGAGGLTAAAGTAICAKYCAKERAETQKAAESAAREISEVYYRAEALIKDCADGGENER